MGGGNFVAFVFDGDGARHAAGGLTLGADQPGFLFTCDVRGAAALSFAVDGDLVVDGGGGGCGIIASNLPGALDFPPDEDALEGRGIELGEHALKGGFLGIIPPAAAVAVAAKGAELEQGELGGEGCQIALAAHDAGEGAVRQPAQAALRYSRRTCFRC